MNETTLKIGKLASALGVSQDALRFYEKQGLINPSLRTAAGYRLYSTEDVKQVKFILSAKRVGFTLNEIRGLLALEVTKDENSCEDVKRVVDVKLVAVNQRMRELRQIKKSLRTLAEACCGGEESATNCTILGTLGAHGEIIMDSPRKI